MSARNAKPQVADTSPERRTRVIRELKLALVDSMEQQKSGGFDPYDASQGRGHTERWATRRR